MFRYLPIAAAVAVLLFSGLVHGVWTDRWADGRELADAATKLNQFPLNAGDWEGTMLPASKSNSGLTASRSARYVHKGTGQAVTVFLGLGRPGPVSIHTPDVCYAASGFQEEGRKEFAVPEGMPAAGSKFLTAEFRKTKAADKTHLRIYWSWRAEGKWNVADNPRLAFFGERVLHKLYVLREVAPGETFASEPCVELMNQLLPALNRTVLPAS